MRTFVSIDLPVVLRDALVEVQTHLRTGRPVPEDNLHLTLCFMGDVGEEQLEDLHFGLEALAPDRIEIAIEGIDLFGDVSRPRMVVALVRETAALTNLQKRVQQIVRKTGIDQRHQRFRPHVTLARFGKSLPADGAALQRFLAGFCGMTTAPVRADTMGLMASELRPEGPVYTALARYPLI